MSWMGWVVIAIMGFNVIFFGTIGVIFLVDKWKEVQRNE